MTSRLTLLTLFLFTFNLQLVHAQDLDTVTIFGIVVDQNGAAIPGAEVTANTRRTTTDDRGRYRLIQLEPGLYTIRVSASGFATQEVTEISTTSGQSLGFDLTLIPSTVMAETVVVTATTAIDTKRTVVGATLTLRETESLPLPSRSVLDLVFTLPGITEEPLSTRDLAEDRNASHASTPEEAGVFSLAGAPAYSNNLTIDGLDNNDDRAARERFQPPVEAVAEVQVITNQFSAEYGRASGGRVNLRTRSGSQQFRGRAFHFFRDEALNANTFRNNSLGLARLPLQEHVTGFTFGGPMRVPRYKWTDRSVFFVSYELGKVLDSALIDTLVPLAQNPLFPLPRPTNPEGARMEDVSAPALAAEVAPFVASISTPLRNTSLITRVDHPFNDLHNVSVVYQAGRLLNLRQFGGGNRLADALQGRGRNSDAISISDNYVFSSRIVNQLRMQYSRLAPSFATQATGNPVVLITLNDPSLSGTLVAGSSTSGSSDRREDRFQAQNVLSVLHGEHSLKFGADVHYVSSTFIDLTDVTGTFNFASAGDFLAGRVSRFRQNFQSRSTQTNRYTSFFVQDEWQAWPQLLVSYGLRYERESILRDPNNFGPRFSLAYSPLESGGLVFRFGSGMFFNRPLLRTIDDFTLGRQQLFFDTNQLRDPLTGKLMTAEQRRAFIAANIRFPGTTDLRQFANLNTNFSRRLDPRLRIPESYQVNAGVERDLGRGYSLEANFSFTRGIHLWREFNANAPVLPVGYTNFSEFLASRDFANLVDPVTGIRPLHNTSTAGDVVRFVLGAVDQSAVRRVVESGVPVSVVNLNVPSSTTAIEVALAALNGLRPDPSRGEVEQLISVGNSFYRGFTIELRKRFDLGFAFRAGYTLSSLTDDGVVNTSDALVPGDFRAERARSLLDRRHRFVFSGTFALPRLLGALQFSPVLRVASGAPFNISLGGTDRNLDDVSNDRPNYSGNTDLLRWRAPGQSLDHSVIAAFTIPTIGQSGNLPRNAGIGPGLFIFDLNVTREFELNDRLRLRPVIEFDNVFNKTVFSFGSEFINLDGSFLVAKRTMRPRQIRVGLKAEF